MLYTFYITKNNLLPRKKNERGLGTISIIWIKNPREKRGVDKRLIPFTQKKKKNPRVQGYDLWIINFRQIYILHLINLTNCYFSSISLKIVVLVHEI